MAFYSKVWICEALSDERGGISYFLISVASNCWAFGKKMRNEFLEVFFWCFLGWVMLLTWLFNLISFQLLQINLEGCEKTKHFCRLLKKNSKKEM